MSVKVSVITLIQDLDSENASDLINSFFKQTLVEKELLVVTDETFDCQEGVKVLVNTHKEYSDKVNEAVKQAGGEYVLFMHPNEYFSDEAALEELITKCDKSEAQAVVFSYMKYDGKNLLFDHYGDNVKSRIAYPSSLPILMPRHPEFRKLTGVLLAKNIVTISQENGQKNLYDSLSNAYKIIFDTKAYYTIPLYKTNSLTESEVNDIPLPVYVEKAIHSSMVDDKIPLSIALCIDNNYGKYLTPLLYSIHQHHKEADIYIIYAELDVMILRLIMDLKDALPNLRIRLKQIPEYIRNQIQGVKAEISGLPVSTYYRLFIPELLSHLDRVLYMDVDMFILQNIDDLFYTDFEGNYLVAVRDLIFSTEFEWWSRLFLGEGYQQYFNGGLLLMNLQAMRNQQHVPKLLNFISENSPYFRNDDQEALNIFYRGAVKHYPLYYNWIPYNYKYYKDTKVEDLKVVHFTSHSTKPWHNHSDDNEHYTLLKNKYRAAKLAGDHILHRQPRIFVFTEYGSNDAAEKHKLESILMQIEANMDLFLIYDDQVAEGIYYYEQLSPFIHLIHRKNRSNLEVINEVLDQQDADYVYCLFGQNCLENINNIFYEMIDLAENYRSEVVFSAYKRLNEKNGTYYFYNTSQDIYSVLPKDYVSFQQRDMANLISLQGTLLKASLLKNILMQECSSEDAVIRGILQQHPIVYFIDKHYWVSVE